MHAPPAMPVVPRTIIQQIKLGHNYRFALLRKRGQISTSILNPWTTALSFFTRSRLGSLDCDTGNGWYRLAFAPNCVAASITHFVSFEVGNLIDTLSRLGFRATVWHWAFIAVLRMETVIYVASEVVSAMKPRARANEDATRKPFRTIVALWGAVIRRDVIVTVGTFRRNSDVDAYLSLCFGTSCREADYSNSSQRKELKSFHKLSSPLSGRSSTDPCATVTTQIILI